MRRWLFIALLGLPLLLLLVTAGVVWWLANKDLKPWAEEVASDALGRRVSAAAFDIAWGDIPWDDPLTATLRDLRIANAPWGSTPDMITLASLDAEIEPMSLWDGVPVYRRLRAEGLKVVLERDDNGTGNWKFGGDSGGDGGGFALIPKNRTQFPTLIDMALQDALITYRAYSGNVLRIGLNNVTIASPGDTTPVNLAAEGAYNDTPLTLTARTDSFREMRDADHPFATDLTIAGRTARVDFKGTMMEPLDADGADGHLSLDAAELDNLLATFGAEVTAKYPLELDGHLTRTGDHWELNGMTGDIAAMPFSGRLVLDEGSRGAPDKIATDLAFDQLDLSTLLGDSQSAGTGDWRGLKLAAPDAGLLLDATLKAKTLSYGKFSLADFAAAGRLGENEMVLDELSFGTAGGKIVATLQVRVGQASAKAALSALDVDRLAQALDLPAGDITGKIDGAADLSLTGATLGDALKTTEGEILLGMLGGSIRESVLELASADLRTLFREEVGRSPVECFGLRARLHDGVAILQPLRLRSAGADLNGAGSIDLAGGEIDLRLQSDSGSTGFFALDLPIRISGSPGAITAGLAGDAPALALPAAPAENPTLRQMRAANPCLQ